MSTESKAKNVLLLDDIPAVRTLLKMYFHGLSVTFWEDDSGESAFYLAKRVQPDLVITGLNLHVVDGVGFLRMLREDPMTRRIPVIVFTARGPEWHALAYQAGASVVLPRPVGKGPLLNAVHRFVKPEAHASH